MIGKVLIFLFLLFLVFLFTHWLRKLKNPITDLTLLYYDETIMQNNDENKCVIDEILETYNPFEMTFVYIIKSRYIVNSTKFRPYHCIYGHKLADNYIYIIASRRFVLLSIIPFQNKTTLRFKDNILTLPYISTLIRYHVFDIEFDKYIPKSSNMYRNQTCIPLNYSDEIESEIIPRFIFKENSNGLTTTSTQIDIKYIEYNSIHSRWFKSYHISFRKVL
jgi:hypothetical protein